MTEATDEVLRERGRNYGDFVDHALLTQSLKAAMHNHPNWLRLAPDMAEALEMIQHKIGRIVNGDPEYADSWVDIQGYARLIENRLNLIPKP